MATPKEAIYSILSTDAQNAAAGHLGNLLGHTGTAPYGIYYMNPPERPDFPLVTYFEVGASGRKPTIEAIHITAWSNDFEEIHGLIYGLLHEKPLGATTGIETVQLLWNWAGPDIHDGNHQIYTKMHRYLVMGVKV